MRTDHIHRRSLLLTFALLLVCTSMARAGGPLLIFDAASRTPYAYASPVNLYTDLGTLGAMSNAQANILVGNTAASWSGVATSSFSAAIAGDMSLLGLGDITLANVSQVIGVDNAGDGIAVIYDTNGTIITNFFGAPPGVLGIASPEWAAGSTITESWMVLNGASIDAADLPLGASFAGVVTHEMGHAINLAHSQTNGAIIFFVDDRGPAGCPLPYSPSLSLAAMETMYPFIDNSPGSTGVQQATVDHLDDQATLSDLYPAVGYPASAGTIEGRIFRPDGVTEISGVNVIARNIANPFLDSQSALSGDFTQGGIGPDGFFRLTGLTPGADYVLYVDTIVAGGFSTTPANPLPGPEEFWNTGETNNSVLDPPCDFSTVSLAVGETRVLDVQLNSAGLPPVIEVSPIAIAVQVAPDAIVNEPLTISNVAGVGGLDLDWSIEDVQALVSTPVFGTQPLTPDRVRIDRTARSTVLDSRDPVLERQCVQCGELHLERRTPVELDALRKAPGTINDGSFELGPFGGAWTESSTFFGTPICDVGVCGTGGLIGPRTGNFWCWFGGIVAAETGSVSQSVLFPNGGEVTLEFYVDQGGCDSTNDFMQVRIDGTEVFIVNGAAANCADGPGYALRSIDVSAWADGAAHTVEFRSQVFGTNGGVTNFFLDDVSLVQSVTPCTWLSASPDNGSAPAGGNSPVTVQIDATGLAPGIYTCELRITSNDPVNPVVTVPVELEVQAAATTVDVIVTSAATGPVTMFVTPGGTGTSLTAAQSWSGVVGESQVVVDATITVQLLEMPGSIPVVGFPADQIGVQAQLGGWSQCASSPLTADGPTDAGGFTTLSGVLHAGGSSAPGELLQVTVDLPNPGSIDYPGGIDGLEIWVNSADLTGDLQVDLSDVAGFGFAFFGPYDFAADFLWDGQLNLSDLARLGPALSEVCPAAVAVTTTPETPTEVIGVYFDVDGTSSSLALQPGSVGDAFVLLSGEAARAGIGAFDLALRTSDNVVIESRAFGSKSLDLGEGSSHVVALGEPRVARNGGNLELMHLRVRVTDDRPAYLWLEPSHRSKLELPAVASEGKVHTAQPSSGDVTFPVASINDPDFSVGGVSTPRRELSLSVAPNPFNPATEIRFALPASGEVDLRILDARGQLVTVLRSEVLAAGEHTVMWNGTDRAGRTVGSGVYFASLSTSVGERTQKLMLIK